MRSDEIDELARLRKHVVELQQRLGVLHCADVNTLARAHKTLAQHIETLSLEAAAVKQAASQLDGHRAGWAYDRVLRQCVQTGGILWLTHLLSWWTRTNVATLTGRRASRHVMWVGAALAAAQLLAKGGRRLYSLVVFNPLAVDRLNARITPLIQRVEIMRALTVSDPRSPPSSTQAASPADPSPLPPKSLADLQDSS